MKRVMVYYKVKKDKVKHVKKALEEFVDAVNKKEPRTRMYKVFQKKDKVSFVHFMCFRDKTAENKHRNSEHVKKFVKKLYPNCSLKPVFTDLNLIKGPR